MNAELTKIEMIHANLRESIKDNPQLKELYNPQAGYCSLNVCCRDIRDLISYELTKTTDYKIAYKKVYNISTNLDTIRITYADTGDVLDRLPHTVTETLFFAQEYGSQSQYKLDQLTHEDMELYKEIKPILDKESRLFAEIPSRLYDKTRAKNNFTIENLNNVIEELKNGIIQTRTFVMLLFKNTRFYKRSLKFNKDVLYKTLISKAENKKPTEGLPVGKKEPPWTLSACKIIKKYKYMTVTDLAERLPTKVKVTNGAIGRYLKDRLPPNWRKDPYNTRGIHIDENAKFAILYYEKYRVYKQNKERY